MTKLIIGIPTINRADLLNQALATYFEDFTNTEIFIVDNGNQEIISRESDFAIYRPSKSCGVAESWNIIMDYAIKRKATHVLMLNDDIVLGKKEQEIRRFIYLFEDADLICSDITWCSFIINVKSFEKVGKFDELFIGAYFEDNDMEYRMKLLGFYITFVSCMNPVVYRNSMTIAKNPSLNANFINNKTYYINKWGGMPYSEKFSTPFNK